MVFRGIVYDLIFMENGMTQVVCKQKHNSQYNHIAFVAYTSLTATIHQIKIEKGDAIKIDYYLKAKKVNTSYFLSAVIEKIMITQKKSPQYYVDMETGEIT